MWLSNDWVTVGIIVLVSVIFVGDAVLRAWQENAWKRRWHQERRESRD